MGQIEIKNSDTGSAADNYTPQVLVVPAEYLMKGVNPFLAGCRHLVKPALAEVHKYQKAVLEIVHEGTTFRRVIKERGFSCEPYFVDSKNNKVPQEEIDKFLAEHPWIFLG